ncbi:hypothetical protein [Scytonema sp. UIC 10036]|uniref:hypothetical protein n=1 Tax=Scytonema sp. UIC 10036 TaxID=2304196 RepID=UPI001A9A8E69|nr:hypothetical protein [Scytonema sp. UIC 10036]
MRCFVFTLMEFEVRLALQQTQQSLAGLYDGNLKRKTERPSAERIASLGYAIAYPIPTLQSIPTAKRWAKSATDV